MTTATDKIIDGKALAKKIREQVQEKIQKKSDFHPGIRKPGLAVILVGNDPASQFYVNKKQKMCDDIGIHSFKTVLPQEASKENVIATLQKYNEDKNVDGILLQLPLPEAIRPYTREIIDYISPNKDVDGLTTFNLGRVVSFDKNAIYPCTPKGCVAMLKSSNIELQGKNILVIGRSELVGKPISLMLNQENATVTMAHSRTQNLDKAVAEADILVVAVGRPQFIKGEWIKENAVVIDVGINSIEVKDENGESKRKTVGDVDFDSASKNASLITPVPGGVGPMTVAMLMDNCYELYEKNTKAESGRF